MVLQLLEVMVISTIDAILEGVPVILKLLLAWLLFLVSVKKAVELEGFSGRAFTVMETPPDGIFEIFTVTGKLGPAEGVWVELFGGLEVKPTAVSEQGPSPPPFFFLQAGETIIRLRNPSR